MIINAAGFGGHLSFSNTGTQFEWIITSIQPQISTEHRNLYTTYGNEQANHLIKKLKYLYLKKIFKNQWKNLQPYNFDDQLEVLNQFRVYISNTTSTKNVLDFSLNKEWQQAAQ